MNVHTGKILWQTQIENTLNLPADPREKAKAERQWIEDLRRQYGRWLQRSIIINRHIYGLAGGSTHTKAGVMALEGGPISPGLFVDTRMESEEDWIHRYGWWPGPGSSDKAPGPNGSPSARANRLFWRSKGYLWCVGDPNQKFPTPKDCPAAAKAKP